jgi:hypothetical protein
MMSSLDPLRCLSKLYWRVDRPDIRYLMSDISAASVCYIYGISFTTSTFYISGNKLFLWLVSQVHFPTWTLSHHIVYNAIEGYYGIPHLNEDAFYSLLESHRGHCCPSLHSMTGVWRCYGTRFWQEGHGLAGQSRKQFRSIWTERSGVYR